MLNLFELFAGIGTQYKVSQDFKSVGVCEIDKSAYASYCALNGINPINYGDIKQLRGETIDMLNVDCLTYSFPCQGLSIANMGKNRGLNNSDSSLLWEVKRLLSECKKLPKVLLLENVKPLVSKYAEDYKQWTDFLDSLGYRTITLILNAYDYGSLQTRERVYAISCPKSWQIPFIRLEELKITLSEEQKRQEWLRVFDFDNVYYDENKSCIVKLTPSRLKYLQKILVKEPKKYVINTLTTKQDRFPNIGVIKFENDYRLITPREAFKIMGYNDEDYNKLISLKLSKAKLYQQAGNAIDLRPLRIIFNIIHKIFKINERP